MKFIRAFEAPHNPNRQISPEAQDILNVLEADWRNMSGTEELPGSGKFDPRKLDNALPYAFVLHRVADGVMRTRVAGQRLHEMMRMDPRGMSFGAFFTDGARDTAIRLAEAALDEPAIIGVPLIASRGLGRKAVRAEALLLPLRDANGELTRVMGALVPSGQTGYRRLQFDIASDQTLRCDPLRLPFPDRRSWRSQRTAQVRAQAAATPTPTPEMVRATVAETGAPALKLVVDNS